MKPVTTPIAFRNDPYDDGRPYVNIDGGCGFYNQPREAGFNISGLIDAEDARRIVASFNALLSLPIETIEKLAEQAKARLPAEAAQHFDRRFEEIL